MIWARLAGERTSLNSCTRVYKIKVTVNSSKERILWGGPTERSDLLWVVLGFRKDISQHGGWGRGEGIGSKKEHGWKVMWQKTRDFGSQMSDWLWFQFRSPGMYLRFSPAPQEIHFFNKYFLSTKECLGLFQILGIQHLMLKVSFPDGASGETDSRDP